MNTIVQINDHLKVCQLLSKPANRYCITIVLCAILDKPEWVTWIYNSELKGYFLGHYFTDLQSAIDDYNQRR